MDPSFIPNMLGAAQAGITNRAGYLVLWPTTSTTGHMDTIRGQLAPLADIEGPDVQPPTLMLDVERKAENNIKQALRQFFKPALVNTRLIQVADRIKAMQDGLEAIFYSNKDYVDSFMGTRANKNYLTRFRGRIMIANYRYKFEDSIKNEKPAMPWPFMDEDLPMNGGTWHQFTADENRLGTLFGYDHSKAIDISRTLLKDEDLALAFGAKPIPFTPPPPEPEPGSVGIPERVEILENKQRQLAGSVKAITMRIKGYL